MRLDCRLGGMRRPAGLTTRNGSTNGSTVTARMRLTYSEHPPSFPVSGKTSHKHLVWFHFVSFRFRGISRGCLQLDIKLLRSTFVGFFFFSTITSLFSQWRWQYVLWCMSVLWYQLQSFLSHWPIHLWADICFLQIHFRQIMTFFRRRLFMFASGCGGGNGNLSKRRRQVGDSTECANLKNVKTPVIFQPGNPGIEWLGTKTKPKGGKCVWPPYNMNVCCDGDPSTLYATGPPQVWAEIPYCFSSKVNPGRFFLFCRCLSSSCSCCDFPIWIADGFERRPDC